MRICIDLDKTVCEPKKEGENYGDVKPKSGVVEKLYQWKNEGHYIIIHTARHMLTCEGDVKKVNLIFKMFLIEWLEKWKIPYDELIMGKPFADVYIDDKALKFEDNWDTIQLPIQG